MVMIDDCWCLAFLRMILLIDCWCCMMYVFTTNHWQLTTADWFCLRLTSDYWWLMLFDGDVDVGDDWWMMVDEWGLTNDDWRMLVYACWLMYDDWWAMTGGWRFMGDVWLICWLVGCSVGRLIVWLIDDGLTDWLFWLEWFDWFDLLFGFKEKDVLDSEGYEGVQKKFYASDGEIRSLVNSARYTVNGNLKQPTG